MSCMYKVSPSLHLHQQITMKILLACLVLLSVAYSVHCSGAAIVAAARSQIGTPYVWGGGGWQGRSKGGFDCSGLAQYAVYKGTGKKIARTAATQYQDHQCKHVAYGQHQAGDLVFFANSGGIHHVGIMSGPSTVVHAPHTGDHVREAPIWASERVAQVARCF